MRKRRSTNGGPFFQAALRHRQCGWRRGTRAIALSLAATLSACVYVPRTTEVYDAQCQILARYMTLDMQQVGGFGGCSNQGCAVLLVTLGAVTMASAVVSGSIVVAGNVVYWFERRGQCVPQKPQ